MLDLSPPIGVENGGFTVMSTALIRITTDRADEFGAFSSSVPFGESRYGVPDLTIHRRSVSHHGDTLRILGHAAEYLINSRLFSPEIMESDDREAIRILTCLSRQVFDEYAVISSHHHPIADWVMGKAVRVYGTA
jgi:hypothetical protein